MPQPAVRVSTSKFSADHKRSALIFLALLLFLAGCDTTGQYNLRVADAARTISSRAGKGGGAADNGLIVASDWPIANPTVAYVKVPKIFETQRTLQAEPRAKPPFLNFPGFLYSYETNATLDGQPSVAYAYFGVVPAAGQTVEQIVATLKTEATAGVPGGGVSDFPYGPQTLAGRQTSYPFARVIITGQQAFDKSAIGGAADTSNGMLDIYIHQTATQFILVGWRFPYAGSPSTLTQGVEAAMLTFHPEGTPAPAAPVNGGQPGLGQPAGGQAGLGQPQGGGGMGGIENAEVNWNYNFPNRTLVVTGKDGAYTLNATVNGQPIQAAGTLAQIMAKLDTLPAELANEVASCKKSHDELKANMEAARARMQQQQQPKS